MQSGIIPLLPGLSMPACIRDGSPDAWGRRVIINRKLGAKGAKADTARLDELTYLLESGSDRIGALDFQHSAAEYVPRGTEDTSLEQLVQAADFIEKGKPLSPELDQALQHGTSLGGARPKAQIDDGDTKYIAKFASTADLYSVVKAEFVAIRLAALAGLNVADVSLTSSLHNDVLLIERFDRVHSKAGWQRKPMVSALTMLVLDEMMARYAGYEDLAELIRHRFGPPDGRRGAGAGCDGWAVKQVPARPPHASTGARTALCLTPGHGQVTFVVDANEGHRRSSPTFPSPGPHDQRVQT